MKAYKKLLICIFCLIIVLPIGLAPFVVNETKTQYEAMTLAKPMTLEQIYADNICDILVNVETYINQHIFKRKQVIDLWSYLLYKAQISSNDTVVIGDENMLHVYSSMHQKRVIYGFDENRIVKQLKYLQSFNDYCKDRNIEFLYVIAPDKETIYPESLPQWYKATGKATPREKLVEMYQDSQYTFKLLDMTDILIDAKEQYRNLLYPKTDTHWTSLGAYLAYDNIMDNIAIAEERLVLERYEQDSRSGYHLVRVLGMDYSRIPDFKVNVDFGNDYTSELECKSDNGEWITNSIDKYNITLYINKKWKNYMRTINNDALNDSTVLIFRDSFASSWYDMLGATFSDVRYIHYENILYNNDKSPTFQQIIEDAQPDIIILEVVERGESLVSKMDATILENAKGAE